MIKTLNNNLYLTFHSLFFQRPGYMGMNDFTREEKMQKIFDDREHLEEEDEEEGMKDDNLMEKEKTVINNHIDNNNTNHNEEKVRTKLKMVFKISRRKIFQS